MVIDKVGLNRKLATTYRKTGVAKKTYMKIISEVEVSMMNGGRMLVIKLDNIKLNEEFIVFDIETTGLSPRKCEITEIGAVKIMDNEIIGRFSALINPEVDIPEQITKLTGISNELVKDKPTIGCVLPKFLEFVGDVPVVAHNAKFDTSFIKEKAMKFNLRFDNTIIDTLSLSRLLLPNLKKHKLDIISEYLQIKLENHHRAVDDAEATAHIFLKFNEMLKEKGVNNFNDVKRLYTENLM